MGALYKKVYRSRLGVFGMHFLQKGVSMGTWGFDSPGRFKPFLGCKLLQKGVSIGALGFEGPIVSGMPNLYKKESRSRLGVLTAPVASGMPTFQKKESRLGLGF